MVDLCAKSWPGSRDLAQALAACKKKETEELWDKKRDEHGENSAPLLTIGVSSRMFFVPYQHDEWWYFSSLMIQDNVF